MPKIPIDKLAHAAYVTRPRYLVTAAGLSGLVCVYALRRNNVQMVKLRNEVYDADKSNGDVAGALSKLQHHVTAHMNTNLTPRKSDVYPPIQLRYTYERQLAASGATATNQQLYNEAQKYCEQQNPTDFSGRNRVPCIQQYVTDHGSSITYQVPDSLYKFDFVSPVWSPDLAGWSLILTILLLLSSAGLWLARRFKRV